MKPEDNNGQQNGGALLSQGDIKIVSNNQNQSTGNESVANVIRAQINGILSDPNKSTTSNNTTPEIPQIDNNKWQAYHSAWQNYYQKYYEGYYTHHLKMAQQGNQKDDKSNESNDAKVAELHEELIKQIKESTTKIKKNRHFWPIISGLIVMVLFLLLQYNRVIISNVIAYVSPGNIDPQNIIIDPNASLSVGPESRLIIPKINVDVPVIYDIGNDHNSQMEAMTKGVAHFSIPGASSHPGEIGNTVIAGHSSNDLLDYGKYKFIFAQLEKINIGDTIYANYNSIRHTYTVTGKEVVKPTEINKLVYETDKPILTLITCTPLGTATNRLLITATQISPDPSKSIVAETKSIPNIESIPGNSPTILERIFGNNSQQLNRQ